MTFRYARHTSDISALIIFYTKILNFEVLGTFKNHAGYDGVFLGISGQNWHLEFTQNGEKAKSKSDEDDALVFYPETKAVFDEISTNLANNEVELLNAKNPYWLNKAICFEDPDFFKIIVSREKFDK